MNLQQYKIQFKIISQIKPDSPKTQLAFQQLGIQPEKEIKSLENFGGTGVTDEIQLIRYEHYLNRLHQKAVEVLQRRKEIIQRNKSLSAQDDRGQLTMKVQIDKMPYEIKSSLGSLSEKNKYTALNMFKMYSTTTSYFRSSHDSPNVKQLQELLPVPSSQNQTQDKLSRSVINDSSPDINGQIYKSLLEREVNSFNKQKLQKLREASIQIGQDKERLSLIDKQRSQDLKVIETAVGEQMRKIVIQNNLKIVREEKMKHIKDTQRDFRKQKVQEIERINSKLEKIRERIKIENEEKEKINDEKLQREQSKKQKVEIRRVEVGQEMMDNMDAIMKDITYKQDETSQRYNDMMKTKQKTLRESLDKASYVNRQASERLQSELQSRTINRAAMKLIKSQANIEVLLQHQISAEINRKQKMVMETQKVKEIQKRKYQFEKLRILDIEKESEQKSENIKSNKIFTKHNQIMKQEQRRLKQEDIQDNYERQKRIKENTVSEMLIKGQKTRDRRTLNAIQNDLIQRSAMEKLEQENYERQRVQEGVRNISDTLFQHKIQNEQVSDWEKIKNLKIAKTLMSDKEIKHQLAVFNLPEKQKSQQIQQLIIKK